MYNIKDYFETETISEATALLAEHPDLKIIAGGTDVLVKMHGDPLKQASFLSIRKIKVLESIDWLENGEIEIGSMATFTKIANDPVIQRHIPVLGEAAVSMGGPQIRNIATIGGNICNGVPSADSAPALFALEARLKLQSKDGERVIPIQQFFQGPGKVDIKSGEMLTAIIISQENYLHCGGHYIKYSMRKAMDIATLGVAVVCKISEENIFDDLRIGLGVAGPTPLRCKEAEAYARGKAATAETLAQIGRLAVKSTKARTSWRASKEYREHLVEELSQRAIKKAVVNAGGEEIA